jgi:hypothetical protein
MMQPCVILVQHCSFDSNSQKPPSAYVSDDRTYRTETGRTMTASGQLNPTRRQQMTGHADQLGLLASGHCWQSLLIKFDRQLSYKKRINW